MRIALLVHGWPPEQRGGTELSTRALARALARRGHEVLVLAGTLERPDPPRVVRTRERDPVSEAAYAVVRVPRPDLYFDHWQKHRSVPVARAVDELLREFRIEVVHVHHWLRLSSDVLRVAARRGVPGLVTLHDHHTTCLLGWRVHPVEALPCARPFSAVGCAQCAAHVPPRTPWVPLDQQVLLAQQRHQAFAAELAAANRVLVPSQAHAEALLRHGLERAALLEVPPLQPAPLAPRPPLPPPAEHGRLVVGAWGLSSPAKGAALARAALAHADRRLPVELRLAGDACDGPPAPQGSPHAVHAFPAYEPEELLTHAVTEVHVALLPTRAPESHGLVADEALALGLPLVLPLSGAFAERFQEGEGVLFVRPGDPEDLGRVLTRLAREPRLLAGLRRRLPEPGPEEGEVVDLLEALYRRAVEEGPAEVAGEEWYEARMAEGAAADWDASLARTPPEELGFGPKDG